MGKKQHLAAKRQGEKYAAYLQRKREAATREMLRNTGADAIQRYMWLSCVALNEEFGFGKERFQRFLLALEEISHEFSAVVERDGAEYAVEKLRQRVEKISEMEVEANADLRRRGETGRCVL